MAENEPPEGGTAKKKDTFFKKNKTYLMIAGGMVVLLLLYLVMKKSSGSSAANTSAATTAANGAIDPSTGYLYGSAADLAAQNGASGATSGVPGPAGATGATGPAGSPANTPDVYTSTGRDIGQYKYGQDELTYLQGNIGSYGITQSEYNDVLAKYKAMVAKYGQAAADAYHYGWSGPGKVSTTNSGGGPGPAAIAALKNPTVALGSPKPAVISSRKTVVQPSTPTSIH